MWVHSLAQHIRVLLSLFWLIGMLGISFGMLCMLGKFSDTELHPSPVVSSQNQFELKYHSSESMSQGWGWSTVAEFLMSMRWAQAPSLAPPDRNHVGLDVDFYLLVLELCKNEVKGSLQLSQRFCQIKIHSTPWSVVSNDLWQLYRVRMVP